jgi:hypothetical protein
MPYGQRAARNSKAATIYSNSDAKSIGVFAGREALFGLPGDEDRRRGSNSGTYRGAGFQARESHGGVNEG